MLIDLRRCIGCQSCTVSCTIENQTPQGAFRTTVNQYQVQREGSQEVTNVLLPRLCNHCDNPPACRSARYKPPFSGKTALWWWITNAASAAPIVSGVSLRRRFINHETQTADKCTFCVHRLEAGLLPACVESCVGGARIIGDIKDPHSRDLHLLHQHRDAIKVLKPENGTSPMFSTWVWTTPLSPH
ncbi:tetrathionate reductase subunit B [Salmonella enterica subsp. enterica]|uniref:Tetrathionate reductase subunit B n=1 Tax=Salmonella enterica I TaxID=59201 RepID=A0A379WWH1_SALET|nr:tetrathionate reductase subunit B [Salmonella enterica subsp. enterica]